MCEKINAIDTTWKNQNIKVPCVVYDESELDQADRIVALVHAKGEPAGRDSWTAVAKSRYERDKKGNAAPALDLLELYLKHGRNCSTQQAERWSGDYPITVLQEALPSIARALNTTTADLVQAYPKKNKRILGNILLNMGVSNIGFKQIRNKSVFWGTKYGLNNPYSNSTPPKPKNEDTNEDTPDEAKPSSSSDDDNDEAASTSNRPSAVKRSAVPGNDPRSVMRKLKSFTPKGNKRDKVVTLLNEMKKLKLEDHPHAFCFLLRSVFEISAKVYCNEISKTTAIPLSQKNGTDRKLVDVLKDIVNHLSNNSTDQIKNRKLHGAMTELSKPHGLLSVTSMNQLVHNPNFSVNTSDICLVFHNIFSLLEEINS